MREERACCFNSGALYSVSLFLQDVFFNWVGVNPVSLLKRALNEFDV